MDFCQHVLGYERPLRVPEAIIFGLQNARKGELLEEDALAFLRHVYNCFYHDFANVDLKNHWQLTYVRGIKSFRNAVLRYGMQHSILFSTRYMTNLKDTAQEEARKCLANALRRS